MAKRFLLFIILACIVSILLFKLHAFLISSQNETLSFALFSVYLFHFVATLIICLAVEILSTKLPNQVGYLYLASVFVKIGFFVIIFKNVIFSVEEMAFIDRISIIIPMFLYLIAEAIYSGRIMNALHEK